MSAASDQVIEKPVVADTPEKFAQTAAQIREEMATGGRYEYIKAGDKAKVEADLDSMAALLQKKGSVAVMRQDEKVQLFNTQEHLNGILAHNDSNRLVCERRSPMGSNIPINTCKTVADIEKSRHDNQETMKNAGTIGATCTGNTKVCKSN